MRNTGLVANALALSLVIGCTGELVYEDGAPVVGGSSSLGGTSPSVGGSAGTSNVTGAGGVPGGNTSIGGTTAVGGSAGVAGTGAGGTAGAGVTGGVGGAGGVGGTSGGMGGTAGTGEEPPGDHARGVQIQKVEANQGVAIALAATGALVPPAERNAELVEGRALLFRAYADVDDGFQARSLQAVLTVLYSDASTKTWNDTKSIGEDSEEDEIDSTFNFLIAPDDVKAGMQFSVELFETTPPTTPPPTVIPRVPSEGEADFGIGEGLYEMRVVVVPALTSGGAPQSTPQAIENLRNHIHDLYPLHEVTILVRDPVPIGNASDRAEYFGALRDLCEAEGLSNDHFYHMVVRRDDTDFSFSGVASGTISSSRDCRGVALTLVREDRDDGVAYIDGNVDTAAHELGHNHGRAHVDCGGPANPDPDYPYADGFLGVQGYSISENELRSTEDYRELMSYCRPRWVSDWMYMRFLDKTRDIHSWKLQSAAPEVGRSLVGYVADTGAHWSLVNGQETEPHASVSKSQYGRVWYHGQASAPLPISVTEDSEGGMYEVGFTLPSSRMPDKAEVMIAGKLRAIDMSRVHVH